MQLDRKALNRLLALNDSQLQALVDKLAAEYGLDLRRFQIRQGDMDGLRRAISNASDAELIALGQQFKNGKGHS